MHPGAQHQEPLFSSPVPERIRVQRVIVRDFKGIDELDLTLPGDPGAGRPDVVVVGSRNGVGKTSLLEAIALGVWFGTDRQVYGPSMQHELEELDAADLLIRSGANRAEITLGTSSRAGSVDLTTSIQATAGRSVADRVRIEHRGAISDRPIVAPGGTVTSSLACLLGHVADPFLSGSALLFHSYRKVVEARPDLQDLVRGQPPMPGLAAALGQGGALSLFKAILLRALMGARGLIRTDRDEVEDATAVLDVLNRLVETYARGRVEHVRPVRNGFDLRVTPLDGRPEHSLDALSSGQKEIIATLFLIWYHTRRQGAVVLVDEPELHLNAEWQQGLPWVLHDIAPHNQYIFATHSTHIFEAVEADRRLLLGD